MHLTALLRPMSACITAAYLNSGSTYGIYLAKGLFSLYIPSIEIL